MRKLTCAVVVCFLGLCGDASWNAPAAEPCGASECQSPNTCGKVVSAGWCGQYNPDTPLTCCGESTCVSNVPRGMRHDSVVPAGPGEVNSCWSQYHDECTRMRHCSTHEDEQYCHWENCSACFCYWFETSLNGAIRWRLECENCGIVIPCYSCTTDRQCIAPEVCNEAGCCEEP